MDGPGDLIARLRAALAGFDDEALAALANRGLVRRARKDLESAAPSILGPDGDRLRIDLGDAIATIDPTPARSSCSCPASGICRHVLGALIFLRESAAEPDGAAGEIATGQGASDATSAMNAPPSAAHEMRAVPDEALARWAGKALVGRAMRALSLGLEVAFEEAGAVVARLPTRNVTCRWMPGGGLEGMVCSCHAAGACEHKVAAVLAFQIAGGVRALDVAEGTPREASAGAPRTRAEVLASVSDVARGLVALGTTRLSRASAERLRTLAVSAHGVDLPRLERVLKGLASEVELGLARAAQADAAGLLARAALVEALAHALQTRPSAALIGEHRTRYELVGDIEIVGLGARRWRARSGYEGLTVYFWDRSAARWATWTEARPVSVGGLNPEARFQYDGPWTGLESPAFASRHALRLTGAYRNRSGRISGRASIRAVPLAPADPPAIPARLDRWAALVDQAALLFGGGLHDRSEQDELVLLAPAGWGPPRFDPIRQEVVREILDAEGRPLALVLPHTPETEQAALALETHDPAAAGTASLLGILRHGADRLYVEPIALHGAGGTFNLTLDSATDRPVPSPRPAANQATPDALDEEPEDDDEDVIPAPSSTRLGMLLDAMAGHLETIGEGGFAAFRGVGELCALANRAEAIGLASCARPVVRVIEHLEHQRRGEPIDIDPAARDLLRAYHVVRLAAAQEAIAVAAARLDRSGSGA